MRLDEVETLTLVNDSSADVFRYDGLKVFVPLGLITMPTAKAIHCLRKMPWVRIAGPKDLEKHLPDGVSIVPVREAEKPEPVTVEQIVEVVVEKSKPAPKKAPAKKKSVRT